MKYDAIVGFAVGKKAEGSAWGTLVREVCDVIAQAPSDVPNMRDYVVDALTFAEEQYKADMNESALPTTYRTAKSVVLKAVEKGVALMEGDSPKGKTAVEAECKDDVPKSDIIDACDKFLRKLNKEADLDKRLIVLGNLKEYVDANLSA